MEKIHYPGAKTPKPQKKTQKLIDNVNEILEEFAPLTLRAVFYKLVSHYNYPNTKLSYRTLIDHATTYRKSGLIYWDAIIDPTRSGVVPWSYVGIKDFLDHDRFHVDLQKDQPYHIELWSEKATIQGVVGPLVAGYFIPFQSNKGNLSTTVKRDSALKFQELDKPIIVLYFGDHDKEGLRMLSNLSDFPLYAPGLDVTVIHVGIRYDQAIKYNLPPVAGKVDSWEVDALSTSVMKELVMEQLNIYMDWEIFDEQVEKRDKEREKIKELIKLLSN